MGSTEWERSLPCTVQVSIVRLLVDVMPFLAFMTLMMQTDSPWGSTEWGRSLPCTVQVSIVRLLVDVMPFLTFMTLMMTAFATALWIVYHPYDGYVKYEFSSIPGVPSTAVRH